MRFPSGRAAHRLLAGIAAAGLLIALTAGARQVQAPASFASRCAQLSEPGGYFDTDNLISNERSYLHVVPALRQAGIAGGAYIGVGPDQNFSYIAQVRPSMAFIIDVRRDNLLLHLLFKALFQLSRSRVEYLSLLFGRTVPEAPDEWGRAGIDRLLAYIDGAGSSSQATTDLRAKVDALIKGFGIPLSKDDLATIDRYHRTFIARGLLLKFETTGRGPLSYYPTYRELLLETDRQGHRWNFLDSDDDYQFVRSLEQRDLIIPVVGNLNGPSALVAIGRVMAERGDQLSVFYASNVEFYLFRDGTFPKFVDNLSLLPHSNRSLIIRAVFAGASPSQLAPGYASSSIVQPVDDLLQGYAKGRFRTYRELTMGR
ncbi:MAG: hypothetical protein LAP85_11215 [Acidobacteriia bacterium]|nr:hypothetical protein [Terriglobia bacterium]